jgi:hypothetical protein
MGNVVTIDKLIATITESVSYDAPAAFSSTGEVLQLPSGDAELVLLGNNFGAFDPTFSVSLRSDVQDVVGQAPHQS